MKICKKVFWKRNLKHFLKIRKGWDRQSFYNSETIQVTGVLISAEGGGNPVVVQNIQEAVMALFQVDAHRIRIMKMK